MNPFSIDQYFIPAYVPFPFKILYAQLCSVYPFPIGQIPGYQLLILFLSVQKLCQTCLQVARSLAPSVNPFPIGP